MRILLAGFFLILSLSSFPEISFSQAVKIDTLKFKPSEYPGLPVPVAAWLEERGMVIPQAGSGSGNLPDNVLQGEFLQSGQTDWAVLTTDGDSLRLWVFPYGRADNPSLVVAEKENYMWDSPWFAWDKNKKSLTYAFLIQNIYPGELIQPMEHGFGMPAFKPVIEHQGISLGIMGKCGGWKYYNHRGIWMLSD